VGFDDVFGDAEAEAGAAGFAGAGGIHAVEAFEDAFGIGEGNADAGVGYGDDGFARSGGGGDGDVAAGRSVLDSIVEEILQHVVEQGGITAHGGKLRRDGDLQSDFLAVGFEERGLGARFDELEQADGGKFDFHFSGFDAGEFEEIVGEAGETHGVIANDFEEAAIVFGIVESAGEESFGKTLDGGERRLEFVGDVGDKILADALEAAEFGDVMKHDDGSGGLFIGRAARDGHVEGFYGRGGDGETLGLGDTHGDVGLQALLAVQGATDEAQKVRVADYFDERAALGGGGIDVQDFRERAIVEDEALLGVNHCDAFDHAAEDGAGAVAFAAEETDFAVHARGGEIE